MGLSAREDYRKRMDELEQELRKQGVRGREFAPWPYRVAWRMGWRVRPPLHQPVWLLAIVWGVPYGVTLALLFWLDSVTIGWMTSNVGEDRGFRWAMIVFMSAFWGVGMAWWLKSRFRDVTLPPWDAATPGEATA
ncbi:MAG: DUF6404 family protein [Planctomycetota bacterium]